jgi:hypothetical protein
VFVTFGIGGTGKKSKERKRSDDKGGVIIFDLHKWRPIGRALIPSRPYAIAVDPASGNKAIVGARSGRLYRVIEKDGRIDSREIKVFVESSIRAGSNQKGSVPINAIAWLRSGDVVVARHDGQLLIMLEDTGHIQAVGEFAVNGDMLAKGGIWAITEMDGEDEFAIGGKSGQVFVFKASERSVGTDGIDTIRPVSGPFNCDSPVRALAYAKQKKILFAGTQSGSVYGFPYGIGSAATIKLRVSLPESINGEKFERVLLVPSEKNQERAKRAIGGHALKGEWKVGDWLKIPNVNGFWNSLNAVVSISVSSDERILVAGTSVGGAFWLDLETAAEFAPMVQDVSDGEPARVSSLVYNRRPARLIMSENRRIHVLQYEP